MNSIDFVIFIFLVNKLCKGHTKEIDNENKTVKMIYSVKTKYSVNAERDAVVVRNLPANAEGARDAGLIPGSGRFPE